MDWVNKSKMLFSTRKPEHFTNYEHCEECAEHDRTLLSSDIDTIGLNELGNPGWDPICFSSQEGKKYYMPAFVRLSLETMNDDFYFGQLLFHLEYDGPDNAFYLACSGEQRKFVASFIAFVIEAYTEQIENDFATDEALKAYTIWSQE